MTTIVSPASRADCLQAKNDAGQRLGQRGVLQRNPSGTSIVFFSTMRAGMRMYSA